MEKKYIRIGGGNASDKGMAKGSYALVSTLNPCFGARKSTSQREVSQTFRGKLKGKFNEGNQPKTLIVIYLQRKIAN